MPYIGNSPGTGTRNRFIFTATASQTTFSGADDNGKTLAYSDGDYVDVYLNGICLVPVDDYAATSKTSIVLTVGAAASDTLEVVAYDIATIADTVSKANGGTFDGDLGVVSDSPDLTFTNSTSEDTDGGRESTITFKGKQSGGEESTLAQIQASHDGTADDEKGDLIFRTNDGSDGSVPTEHMRISSAGNVLLTGSNTAPQFEISRSEQTNQGFSITAGGGDTVYNSIEGTNTVYGTHVWQSNKGTDTKERMKIDNNGALLVNVGQTTSGTGESPTVAGTGYFFTYGAGSAASFGATSQGTTCAYFNRAISNGIIIDFRIGNATVGDIGSRAGFLNIGDGDVAIEFHSGDNTVYPTQASPGGYNLTDNFCDLGGGSYRWKTVYAGTGTINTSDANQKQQIASLTDAELTAATAISKLFKTFKWNDAVEEKGDSARIHAGVIAQQVEQAMTDAGLDASKYGFFCRDTVYETFTEIPAVEADEENGIAGQAAFTKVEHYHSLEEAPEGAVERTTKGVRYAELLSFIGAATEQRLASIESRLDALEAN